MDTPRRVCVLSCGFQLKGSQKQKEAERRAGYDSYFNNSMTCCLMHKFTIHLEAVTYKRWGLLCLSPPLCTCPPQLAAGRNDSFTSQFNCDNTLSCSCHHRFLLKTKHSCHPPPMLPKLFSPLPTPPSTTTVGSYNSSQLQVNLCKWIAFHVSKKIVHHACSHWQAILSTKLSLMCSTSSMTQEATPRIDVKFVSGDLPLCTHRPLAQQ